MFVVLYADSRVWACAIRFFLGLAYANVCDFRCSLCLVILVLDFSIRRLRAHCGVPARACKIMYHNGVLSMV